MHLDDNWCLRFHFKSSQHKMALGFKTLLHPFLFNSSLKTPMKYYIFACLTLQESTFLCTAALNAVDNSVRLSLQIRREALID